MAKLQILMDCDNHRVDVVGITAAWTAERDTLAVLHEIGKGDGHGLGWYGRDYHPLTAIRKMLAKLKGWLRKDNSSATKEAELLMQLMGDKAYQYIYARSRNMQLTEAERDHALKVRRIIEKKLGIEGRLDTATRYLDG